EAMRTRPGDVAADAPVATTPGLACQSRGAVTRVGAARDAHARQRSAQRRAGAPRGAIGCVAASASRCDAVHPATVGDAGEPARTRRGAAVGARRRVARAEVEGAVGQEAGTAVLAEDRSVALLAGVGARRGV